MLRFIKFCSLGLLFLVALVLINALTHNPENEKFLNKITFKLMKKELLLIYQIQLNLKQSQIRIGPKNLCKNLKILLIG